MKKILHFTAVSFVFLCLCGCHNLYKKQQALNAIDNAAFAPEAVFIYGDILYISYVYNDAEFYLSAELPKEGSRKSKKNAVMDADIVQNIPEDASEGKEEIPVARNILDRAAEEVIAEVAPKKNNSGTMLLTGLKDVVLYRDENGNIKISDPANIPGGITVEGKVSRKLLRKRTYENIIEFLKREYPDKKDLSCR